MAKEYKFDRNFNKRSYDYQLGLGLKTRSLGSELDAELYNGIIHYDFYNISRNSVENIKFKSEGIMFMLKENRINSKTYSNLLCDLEKIFQKAETILEIVKNRPNGECNKKRSEIIKELINTLVYDVKDLYEKDREKEDDLKALSSTSKKFFQFNGFHAIFNKGYFGKNFTLAEKICDYLGLTEKIKERFYLEVTPADDLPKSNETPKNESTEISQFFSK